MHVVKHATLSPVIVVVFLRGEDKVRSEFLISKQCSHTLDNVSEVDFENFIPNYQLLALESRPTIRDFVVDFGIELIGVLE